MKTLVSICCPAYNHANFIRQCLDGFLMQETNFDFEVLIHDDASTDNTADIIRDYAKKYPNIIKPIYQTENQYSKGVKVNPVFNFSRAKGKYIALCEGDDFWLDRKKLQKQVDALEQNPEIKICIHPSKLLKNNEFVEKKYCYWGEGEHVISPEKVIENFISSGLQSIVFRNENINLFKGIIEAPVIGVHSNVQIYYGIAKGILYLPEEMAVYRVASSSSVSKVLFKKDKGYTKRMLGNLVSIDRINKVYDYKYKKQLNQLKRDRIYFLLNNKKVNLFTFLYISIKYNMFKNLRKHYYYMINYFNEK